MVEVLEAGYGNKLSKEPSKIYWDMLNKYDDKIVKETTIRCIRELKYFPKISEIIEMIEGTLEDEVELAWGYLIETIEREGLHHSVSFPKYPAVGATIEQMAGGWCEFIELFDNDKEKWIKKDFLRIYPIMKRRGIFHNRLAGRFELDNLNKGYTKETMIRYGIALDGKKIDRKLIENKTETKKDKYDKYLRKE